jgi:hypothetical protein
MGRVDFEMDFEWISKWKTSGFLTPVFDRMSRTKTTLKIHWKSTRKSTRKFTPPLGTESLNILWKSTRYSREIHLAADGWAALPISNRHPHPGRTRQEVCTYLRLTAPDLLVN